MRSLPLADFLSVVFSLCLLCPSARAADGAMDVGAASIDITPSYPVRLNGFRDRLNESEGVTAKIFAKALAVGGDDGAGPAIIVAVDNLGVPDYLRRDVAERLHKKAKIDPARFSITSTHTHTAPMLTNVAPTLFARPIPPEHQAHIDQYTRDLADNIEKAALAALADRKPATLAFGIGKGALAANRRTAGGPVDHDLPVLVVRSLDGTIRAVYTSYACHCVTLSNGKISGDWAGYVQETIEHEHPGAVALTSVGCGADANPTSGVTGDRADIAAEQGRQIAAEVERVLKSNLTPITAAPMTRIAEFLLPLEPPPSREEFEKRAPMQDAVGYHARVQIAKLDRGEKLQTDIPYHVQTWTFGDQLAMVFLSGEVVVDYSLRLKTEFDRTRLWINGYSNDVPCYIPSERILKEGGYEGNYAMFYYDRPNQFKPGLEKTIIDEVHLQLPAGFLAPKGTEGSAPKSADASLKSIRTKPGLRVELAASEPLVTSPVAIDWAADGAMWVCEMLDYPAGIDGNWQPGGRVKRLVDTDGDGKYDKATVFLDGLPFPTGVTAWGKGVLICAAPDILYAEDTDGDGKADKIEKRFTGFATDNYQARVNSLSLGLDNWIYGANGLLGGTIRGAPGLEPVDIRGHDFRFRPSGGPLEIVAGPTQQGRVRDDWGRWFGCDNSTSLRFYPHEARYLLRNPSAPAPEAVVSPEGDYDVSQVFPISSPVERFNSPESVNHVTSACGLGIYRDTLLGAAYAGNAFVCEPVHNLVHRMILNGDESGLHRSRAEDEKESEFFASSDGWSRPVQVRAGPDGAMYVVDMYRFMIEHPRWIPAARLAQLDPRAGATMGRIYRIACDSTPVRPIRDLTKLSTAELAQAIDSPSGTDRDRVHIELLARKDLAAIQPLAALATGAALPQVRVQALAAIDGLGGTTAELVKIGLKDADAQVRVNAVRVAEPFLTKPADINANGLAATLAEHINDPAPSVRHQLALSLGEWNDPRAGQWLAQLAVADLTDADLRLAVLSSASQSSGVLLAAIAPMAETTPGREAWIGPLVATAAASKNGEMISAAVLAVLPAPGATTRPEHLTALAELLDSLDANHATLHPLLAGSADAQIVEARIGAVISAARKIAVVEGADRALAIRVLGHGDVPAEEIDLLCSIASTGDKASRDGAIIALRRQTAASISDRLLATWPSATPAARTEFLSLLLGRDEWATSLLQAVRDGRVPRAEISIADRQRLAASSSEAVRKAASETFSAVPVSGRAEVLARYGDVSKLTGNEAKGQALFAATCSPCHAFGGQGHAVGPDLAALRGKDVDYFVKNILDPSAVVEPRFVSYQILLRDRRAVAGIISAEAPASLTLISGGGATETVARSDIKTIRASDVSLMPEGLEAALPPQEMADLVAYLRSNNPPKQIAGNTPAEVKPTSEGSIFLLANAAELRGTRITFESGTDNIGYWHGAEDNASWSIELQDAGDFDIYLDYACAENSAGNTFRLSSANAGVEAKVKSTGLDWSNYHQTKIGTLELAAGAQQISIRPTGSFHGALMDLRTVALSPHGVAPHWPATLRGSPAAGGLARDPASVAAILLDPTQSDAARTAAIDANPQFSAELITEMTRDLAAGTPAENDRIPWIWQVALLGGKRNDTDGLRKILNVSLPREAEPLRDWQAVVIGGGVINGLSQRDIWPATRIAEVIGQDTSLKARWERSIALASEMANDPKIQTGTRYDALRMLGVESFEKRGTQLSSFLTSADAELQSGAVSALADIDSPQAADALISSLPKFTADNREHALDALLRSDARIASLLAAVEGDKIDAKWIGKARTETLLAHPDGKIRERAKALRDRVDAKP